MAKRIDEKEFTKITGKTFNEIFDLEKRISVTVTAKELKKLGVVDKIIRLNDVEIKSLSDKFAAFTDFFEPELQGEGTQGSGKKKPDADINNNNPKTIKKMTKAEILANHPELYKEIYGEGVKAEKDRVGAIMAFNKIDPEAVKKAIDSGDAISETFRSEMQMKAMSPEYLEKIKKENATQIDAIINPLESTVEKTDEEKEVEAMQRDVNNDLNIEKKEDK